MLAAAQFEHHAVYLHQQICFSRGAFFCWFGLCNTFLRFLILLVPLILCVSARGHAQNAHEFFFVFFFRGISSNFAVWIVRILKFLRKCCEIFF